jgi:hypothetical protein
MYSCRPGVVTLRGLLERRERGVGAGFAQS